MLSDIHCNTKVAWFEYVLLYMYSTHWGWAQVTKALSLHTNKIKTHSSHSCAKAECTVMYMYDVASYDAALF